MNFEHIERAYELILENIQLIENQIKTHLYDALIEQNSFYLGESSPIEKVNQNNEELRELKLTKEEWRRVFQFIFIKAGQTEKMQLNHQFTPDSIGFIILFLLETLVEKEDVEVLEIGSGTGNLAETLYVNSNKNLDIMGVEVDDLLIDLAASISEVMDTPIHFVQEDAVRPQLLKESDVIISDLPIGYYPNDEIAKRYEVASQEGHTYAHHLLMEQSLKYLKKNGYAIFLAPVNLLTSEQSPLLKKWLKDYATVSAVITLPEDLFSNKASMKSLVVLQKQVEQPQETFVYPLQDLQNQESLVAFMSAVKQWREDTK